MPLYKVRLEYVLLVDADNDSNAASIAEQYVTDQDPDDVYTEKITNIKGVPSIWLDCHPYNQDGEERTIAEILGIEPPKEKDPNQTEMVL